MKTLNYNEKAIREIIRKEATFWLWKRAILTFIILSLFFALLGYGLYFLMRDTRPKTAELSGGITVLVGSIVALYAALTTKRTREYIQMQIEFAQKLRAETQQLIEQRNGIDVPLLWHQRIEMYDVIIDELIEQRKGIRSVDATY